MQGCELASTSEYRSYFPLTLGPLEPTRVSAAEYHSDQPKIPSGIRLYRLRFFYQHRL
jgi:hypothetical protein